MIEVINLNKSFNHGKLHLLKDINFKIDTGKIFGLIGKSGAGKSTLLKCLNLLEHVDSGKIIIDNKDVTSLSKNELAEMRKQVGVIFQGFNLLNSKTVFDNVAFPLIINRVKNINIIKSRVNEILNIVGLENVINSYPCNLSGGQKQRVGIARALINNPNFLLSDEATSSLDAETTNSILDLLLKINKEFNITIFLITHEIDVVKKICDDVAVIDNGRIVECKSVVDLMVNPQHELSRKLLEQDNYEEFIKDIMSQNSHTGIDNNKYLLLTFIGNDVFEPILSTFANKYNIDFNILKGDVGFIKKTPYGKLLLCVRGEREKLENSLVFFEQNKILCQVLN